MKKTFSFALVFLFALILSLSVHASVGTVAESDYAETKPNMKADVLDESWGEVAVHVDKNSPNAELAAHMVSSSSSGGRVPEDGLDIYTRWDDEYLYLCFVSPDLSPSGDSTYYYGDGIMMVILPGDDVHYSEALEDAAFTYTWSLDQGENGVTTFGAATQFDPTIAFADGNMIAKIAIPMKYLGIRADEEKTGLEFAVKLVRLSGKKGDTSLVGWLAWGKFYEKDLVPGDPETKADGPNTIRLVRKTAATEPTEEPKEETPTTPAEAPSSWAADEVSAAISLGLVPTELQKGYTTGISRAQLASMLALLLEKAGVTLPTAGDASFADTDDKNVLAAANLGIINGYKQSDGTVLFKPDNTLKRSEMAAIINRVAKVCGIPTTGYEAEVVFTDTATHWCRSELGYPVHMGIVKGTSTTTFSPENTLTVEQTIMMVNRTLAAISK